MDVPVLPANDEVELMPDTVCCSAVDACLVCVCHKSLFKIESVAAALVGVDVAVKSMS